MTTRNRFDPSNPESVRAFLLSRSIIDANGCWVWQGAISSTGYGNVCQKTDGRKKWFTTHRLAYTQLVGPIPDGLDIDHKCRNRACCNPAHLEPVTRRVNLLRGETIPAVNSRKTHCVHGHEYTEENTYWNGNSRQCRTCTMQRHQARIDSKNALLNAIRHPNPTQSAQTGDEQLRLRAG